MEPSNQAVGAPLERHVRPRARYVDAVMREVYAATSWDARIAEIEQALWAALDSHDAQLRAALIWYRDEAVALAKHMAGGAHTQAVLASVTVLALDAGKRADDALAA